MQEHVEGGIAAMVGICAPTAREKRVYQRLADKASSLPFGRYPKPCHGFDTHETLWSVLLLREEVSHL